MSMASLQDATEIDRKRRVRRNAIWLAALAIAIYAGFILLSVTK
jgi:hypothetical protein